MLREFCYIMDLYSANRITLCYQSYTLMESHDIKKIALYYQITLC